MNNRTSYFLVLGLIGIAVIGVVGNLVENPTGFLTRIGFMVLGGIVIYFLVNRFYLNKTDKSENRAFAKAAKQSKKRLQQKDTVDTTKRTTGTVTSLKKTKKVPGSHLTVIEGKKGKKKNRASF